MEQVDAAYTGTRSGTRRVDQVPEDQEHQVMEQVNQEAAGRWVPSSAAAAELGTGVDTVRKRARRGRLIARQVPRPQGHIWEVLLQVRQVPDQDPDQVPEVDEPGAEPGEEPGGPGAHPVDAAAIIDRLLGENRQLHTEVAQLAGQVGYLQAQLQQRDERIALLEAPAEKTSHDVTISHAENKSPWWAFWRRTAPTTSPA